jgi:glycerophosphoryl diester phosphodiesterase
MATRRFFRIFGQVAVGLALILSPVLVYNSSAFAPAPTSRPLLIAHRGLGQTFSREGLTGDTCTATRIFPPEHSYLENTIASFTAAFAAGADIVEFDVHPTTDGEFVVFHDWTLDCRTDGKGVTREHSLAQLKALDVGYGYTADGGRTYPFRGKGVGLMPTLDEALAAFPDRRFLINVKSDDAAEGKRLAARLGELPRERRALLMIYGGGLAMDAFHAALPEVTVLGTDAARSCLIRYALTGWLGVVPDECRNTLFMLPLNYAPLAWGYPNLLTERLRQNGTRLVLLGAYDGSGFSSGIDDPAAVAAVPARLDGAIWTNRIDLIGPSVTAR